ncbi:hypothetical protein [Streptococcus iners]|uniref:Uncharacterized protein n=1 Tax=Streptococcus iners subsp. hyiners TaxID=3028083 RepID=A0AA96VHF2_9STRE|nr:hypothetical protein [Streptococcus sp. 29892]MCK3942484.1 hypothetical protein [Streptococcus suis]MCK4030406.1 hypothetical protein [Streptococcus suis]WNY49496.1 hypothetical protein PW220_02250 [Streptococcus sp. 29892]
MSTSKLTAFAQAVGTDIKELKQALGDKVTNEVLTQAIEQAKTALKSDILGEGVPEQLDTLKEIAQAISAMNGEAEQAVVQKIAELGQKVDAIANLDLVAVYTAAKA